MIAQGLAKAGRIVVLRKYGGIVGFSICPVRQGRHRLVVAIPTGTARVVWSTGDQRLLYGLKRGSFPAARGPRRDAS